MINYNRTVTCGLMAAALAMPSLASAYGWDTCGGNTVRWKSNPTFRASDISFPSGSQSRATLQSMVNEINRTNGFNLNVGFGTDTGNSSSFNGVNEIGFVSDLPSDVLGNARTKRNLFCYSSNSARIQEADIRFNSNISWTNSAFTGANFGSPFSLALVALHEFGHGLGLNHYNNTPATMNAFYPNGGSLGRNTVGLHGDDTAGLRWLYGGGSGGNDLFATKFKNAGATMERNLIRTTGGSITTSLNKGTSYQIDYSLQNKGSNRNNNVITRLYASTNAFISTSDYYLGQISWSMPAGSHVESNVTVNIPNSIPSGQYYIGYVVDSNRQVSESNESNNQTYLSVAGTGDRYTIN